MSIRKIKTGPKNPVLRKKAETVKQITPEVTEVISDMIDTLEHSDTISSTGIGLAAPQIGRSWRIIIIRLNSTRKPTVFINPVVIKASKRTLADTEACLSLPGIFIPVKRSVQITLEAQNERGEPVKLEARDMIARVIQHETDHLEGILITDYAVKVETK